MAGNPYDQFDAVAAPAATTGNPYDKFDVSRGTSARRAPAPPPPLESAYSAKNLAGAATEPALSLATGAVAGPLSGLAGIAGAALPGPPGQGADWTRRVGNAMTYQPHTAGGRTALGAMTYPFEKIGEGADWAGGKVAGATGSPAAGAGTNALLQVLPQLLLSKGMSKAAPIPGELTAPPNVKMLADKGVTMTPGQIKGGLAKRMEEKTGSIPLVGDAIREAKVKGVEDFNRAGINDALKPIGKELPEGLKGNKAIEWAQEELGSAYEALLPNMTGNLNFTKMPQPAPPKKGFWEHTGPQPKIPPPPPGSLSARLDSLVSGFDSPMRGELKRIIEKEIKSRAEADGALDGATLKNIQSKLTGLDKSMRRSENYDVRELGIKLREANQELRTMIEEMNPQFQGELSKINQGYAKFKIAQRAASSTGAKEGVFTPTQYHSAVKAKDASKDNSAFSKGAANQQDLSSAGKGVLPDVVGDSGTADRLLLAEMIRKPWWIPPAWAASLAYSRPALRAMQPMLMAPPNSGHALGRAMPYGAMQQGLVPPPPQ